jgi:cytochrome c peroxidase
VNKISGVCLGSAALLAAVLVSAAPPRDGGRPAAEARLTPRQELGRKLFFDARLSTPEGQSCAACHAAEAGWTGPNESDNKGGAVYQGAQAGRFGNRKPPSAAYAGWSPVLHRVSEEDFAGGMFWDGRATGDQLGDPLAEQALGPFLNPLEQNDPDSRAVVERVKGSDYAALFERVWGPGSLDPARPKEAFEKIGRSIAAFERSPEVNPFSSRFDGFWSAARRAGLDPAAIGPDNASRFAGLGLDARELRGLVLFAGRGRCASCHPLTPEGSRPPVFTDYTYDNLGVPANPRNPFYTMDKKYNPEGRNWVDRGLGGFLEGQARYARFAPDNLGKQKVPTLRNVDRRPSPGFVKAYMHNGYFKSLKDVVHFYNTRDAAGARWPAPEVAVNVNREETGDLGLTGEEEDLIVLFLKTLSDR